MMLPRASEIAQSDTIIVSVGPEHKKYTLHKKLLTHHSVYFRGALSGNFKESVEGVVPLTEDVEIDTFEIFVDWLYEKRLPDNIDAKPDDTGISIKARAYVLADRLIAAGFKKAVFDSYFSGCSYRERFPRYETFAFGFTHLRDEDPLLQMWIDTFCRYDGIHFYDKVLGVEPDPSCLPKQAMVRIFQTMHTRRGCAQRNLVRSEYDI